MSASLAFPLALSLAQICAPQVAPETLLSLARAESAFDPLIIGVNTRPHRSLHPTDLPSALNAARNLQAAGADFDIGLTQINVHNLARLGISLGDAFNPCRNLAGGGRILTEAYLRSRSSHTPGQALVSAMSLYNTGDPQRGIRNGYVSRVYQQAAIVVPAIRGVPAAPVQPASPLDEGDTRDPAVAPSPETSSRASLDVFDRGSQPSVSVWSAPAVRPQSRPAPPRRPIATFFKGDPS